MIVLTSASIPLNSSYTCVQCKCAVIAVQDVADKFSMKHAFTCRLRDVLWDNHRLYLIMEHLDRDLREHLDVCSAASALHNVKVQGHAPTQSFNALTPIIVMMKQGRQLL